LFVNFFQPSFKLAEKKRTGARVSKRYHAPETPAARLLANAAIEPTMRERLKAVLATVEPTRQSWNEDASTGIETMIMSARSHASNALAAHVVPQRLG